MAKSIYDKFGFDKDGYNKDGFDRMGYNRDGYDRQGFDRNGLNRRGINKLTGYDKDGYDKDGFNVDGYDRDGYDRNGYNSDGYDRQGYDHDGFDCKGFNCEGYNRAGYDSEGYDANGYGRDGYNRAGIDTEGYNRQGYNSEGYDRNGYNRLGYDKSGYNCDGYDKEGYGRDGFNAEGINRDGYDRNGVDSFGFNYEGKNVNGYNIYGISEDGIDILGYDADGFDSDGISIEGLSKDSFDEEGYNIYTGFNLKGFDREGFNINGVDSEGYDHEGYHFESGFNREGYDREGYNRAGYSKDGYDREGFNREGYDVEGFDVDGYDHLGYDRNGLNHEGYDKRGYDINGYDSSGILDPVLREAEISASMDEEENRKEVVFSKKCEAQIKGNYRMQVEKEVMKDYKPYKREYIDQWGFMQREIIQPDMRQAQAEINSKVNAVLDNPYFCHIDYKLNPELYLGKQAVYGWITDWADEQASLYYQYQMYIGNKETELNLVRDIVFKKGKYKGYKDLYNRIGKKDKVGEIADEHLLQIIEANQKNKKVHDIVESIQLKQYDIITADKDSSSLILGCAGSGKTMIFMHKIRYMKYNHRDLKMDDVIVVSPTDILGRESRELSRILQVDRIHQYTTASFYEENCKRMLEAMKVPYEEFHVIDDGKIINTYYNEETLRDLRNTIVKELGSSEESIRFYDQQETVIKHAFDHHVSVSGLSEKKITEMHRLYADSIVEIQKAGKKDIDRIIRQIDSYISKRSLFEEMKSLIEYMLQGKIFQSSTRKILTENSELETLFYYTKNVVEDMDFIEFRRACDRKKIKVEDAVQCVQILQLFTENKLDLQGVHKLLNEWDNISEQQAKEYIRYVNASLARIDHLEQKRDVLQYLIDNDIVKNKVMENKSIKYDSSFEKLLKLFEGTEEDFERIGLNPFSYFEQYEKITRRRKRLSNQRKNPNGRAYLYDAILDELNITYSIDSDICVPVSSAFAMTYLLCEYNGAVDNEKKYMYIDEFQDFSPLELQLFSNLYPYAVVNLLGDVNQCINQKGIKDIREIPSGLYEVQTEPLNEDYRNARQITDYVNEVCVMNMLPVGLNGVMQVVADIPDIKISSDDRVAVIVSDDEETLDQYQSQYHMNVYVDSKEIVRGVYNVLPVSMAKGLEFEKVIVFQEGMTKNEFYVACTRAISELYVIESKNWNKTVSSQTKMSQRETVVISKPDEEVVRPLGKMEKEVLQQSEEVDIHDYRLIAYQGKLKKHTGMKRVPATHVSVTENGKEKKIPICYIVEKKCAYVPEATYAKHKKELDAYFSCENNIKKTIVKQHQEMKTAVIDEPDMRGTVVINEIPKEKEKREETKNTRDLETYVFQDTKTVDLMDRYEGKGSDKPYDRLIIKHAMYIHIGSEMEMLDLVVERSMDADFQGDITFTQFKKGEDYELREFVRSQFTVQSLKKYKKTGEMCRFDKPYLLRAQNSRNRSGYGWEWDWSNRYSPLVSEGTYYGETTNYVFVGAYVGR